MYSSQPYQRRRAVRPSPIFLAFIGVAVVGAILSWSDSYSISLGQFGVFLFVVGGWVVSLCLHEFAHAYAAYRAGDHSVEAAGYLTLNPLKYAHPLLSIVLPVAFIALGGIGLPGGAVYLHPHAFRSRRQRSIASAVGPLTNLVFALVLLQIVRSQVDVGPDGVVEHGRFWVAMAFLGFLQVSAAVLNFLPVPGLDGYAIIEPYLAPETQRSFDKVKPWGMLGLFVVLFYIPAVNERFFDLVNWVYAGVGGSDNDLWRFGYEYFKFWNKLG